MAGSSLQALVLICYADDINMFVSFKTSPKRPAPRCLLLWWLRRGCHSEPHQRVVEVLEESSESQHRLSKVLSLCTPKRDVSEMNNA